ncbi:MAG: hypothetical protein AAB401_10615 [Acidobacteriota bacterium]
MWEDPIVNEVRQQRLALETEAGNDWEEIVARAIEAQRRFAAQSVQPITGQRDTHYDVADFEADLRTLEELRAAAI